MDKKLLIAIIAALIIGITSVLFIRLTGEVGREQAIKEKTTEEYVPAEQPVGKLLAETP